MASQHTYLLGDRQQFLGSRKTCLVILECENVPDVRMDDINENAVNPVYILQIERMMQCDAMANITTSSLKSYIGYFVIHLRTRRSSTVAEFDKKSIPQSRRREE